MREYTPRVLAGAATLLIIIAAVLGTGCDLAMVATPQTAQPTAATNATAVQPAPTAARGAPVASQPQAPAAQGDFRTAVRDVAATVRPAVVQITSQQVEMDPSNRPFTVPAGVGSGVIYDRQGRILTNNHVVEGADQLLVSLPDGRSFQGRLVGRDPQTDLAVVQIQGDNLPVAQLGDSNQLQIGDWVVAIGNALALPGGPTVTAGTVGALKRTVQEPGSSPGSQGPFLFDMVQTDAPINPGNSGGALANLDGQVVGINTLVAGQAEPGVQAQGIGFAISINTAKHIADELVSTGKAVHPYIGIRYVFVNPAIAAQLRLQQTNGVVIRQVVSGSPAAQAGLRAGDVITMADGKSLNTESSLAEVINNHNPGDTITLTVIRGGSQMNVQVTLAEMPS